MRSVAGIQSHLVAILLTLLVQAMQRAVENALFQSVSTRDGSPVPNHRISFSISPGSGVSSCGTISGQEQTGDIKAGEWYGVCQAYYNSGSDPGIVTITATDLSEGTGTDHPITKCTISVYRPPADTPDATAHSTAPSARSTSNVTGNWAHAEDAARSPSSVYPLSDHTAMSFYDVLSPKGSNYRLGPDSCFLHTACPTTLVGFKSHFRLELDYSGG